jgi:2-C-methyl-D-erythritol 4-phosphate cytidylyltransferase/2-C-methyl-D-erythritol 2,4-cyclodiphosphate synthase
MWGQQPDWPRVTTAALIVAAGRGHRAGGGVPKQYASIGGMPVLARTLGIFTDHPQVDWVLAVTSPQDRVLYDEAVSSHAKLLPAAAGDDTRQGSVLNGLRALLAKAPARVLIHDAVRPFVQPETISAVLDRLDAADGAIAAVPLADTLKRSNPDNTIAATLDRAGLWRAQTPQGFRFRAILDAHEAAAAAGHVDLTDDAAVAEWAKLTIALVPGSEHNRKITTAEDLALAERISSPAAVRTGQGFDVHRFAPGDHVWLCGIRIPHTHSLEGHSDADVALHALTDALLGAIGDADIGTLFPNTDPRWKGAASHLFLSEAARRVRARNCAIANVDLTILCEAPKISPYREAMCTRIADVLGVARDQVAVKATTTEGLGFTGRREGIAAMATATVVLR